MKGSNKDTRNVTDEFKGIDQASIIAELDASPLGLEIAIENTLRDYNMGSIIRTANAMGVRKVHVIGRKQWNRRGAMMTETYLHLAYHDSVANFAHDAYSRKKAIVAVDNVDGAVPLQAADKQTNAILVFGQEGPGLSNEVLEASDQIVGIEQYGSTRSINVAAAAAIVMYEWRHAINY